MRGHASHVWSFPPNARSFETEKKTKNEESRIEISIDRLDEIAFSLSITSCYILL
jgi:hypothetical protein